MSTEAVAVTLLGGQANIGRVADALGQLVNAVDPEEVERAAYKLASGMFGLPRHRLAEAVRCLACRAARTGLSSVSVTCGAVCVELRSQ